MARLLIVMALLLATFVPIVDVRPAYACSCATRTPAQYADSADVVLVGTVDGVGPLTRPDGSWGSLDPVPVRVTVERYLKGSGGAGLTITTARSGASCGALERLDVGQRHVLFLRAGETHYTTSLCSGNAPLIGVAMGGADGQAYLAEVEAITGPGVAPHAGADTFPGTGIPDNPPRYSVLGIGMDSLWAVIVGAIVIGVVTIAAMGGLVMLRMRSHASATR